MSYPSRHDFLFEDPLIVPPGVQNPDFVCSNQRQFRDLVLEGSQDRNLIIPTLGMTIDDLGNLFRKGGTGWLSSEHMIWICKHINDSGSDTLCFYLQGVSWRRVLERRPIKAVKRLAFILNVGMNSDNTVFIADGRRSGCHWVMAVVYLSSSKLFYCDSLAWDTPTNLIDSLCECTSLFGINLSEEHLVQCHIPSSGIVHQCSLHCTNYSLQTCSEICDVVVIINSAVCAFDPTLFEVLISNNQKDIYLKRPSLYNVYLRKVLIEWFISGRINMTFVSVNDHALDDHNYSGDFEDFVKGKRRQNRDASYKEVVTADKPGVAFEVSCQDSFVKANNVEQKLRVHECISCKQNFSTRQALWKHKKRKHSNESNVPHHTYRKGPTCVHCHCCVGSITELISHYNNHHGMQLTVENKEFLTEEDFKSWKVFEEKRSKCMFVARRGDSISKSSVRKYFYCSRSQGQGPHHSNLKRVKFQVQPKLSGDCPAFIRFEKDRATHAISIDCCLDHNHECSLSHLRLSDELRGKIAGKLSSGVKIEVILDEIRDNVTSIDRDSLVMRKDIHNIKRGWNVDVKERHSGDATSVDLLVNELNSHNYKQVICYKPQGEISSKHQYDDFLIGLQTEFQRDMLVKFGGKCVCVDSTHKTNMYDFLLVTLLVLDDLDQGIPVAWLICNHEDVSTLQPFFAAIKSQVGDICAEVFMSDLAATFYNAWTAVFTKPKNRLYCSWHVDKSWRKNLQKYFKCAESKVEVYTLLKTLQYEVDEGKFRKMLQEFHALLNQKWEDFGKYFFETYVASEVYRLWASCFRTNLHCPNTNMHVEAFHRLLKDIYFQRKQNRRLDHLLHVLLKIAKDKAFEQLIKLSKGKLDGRVAQTLNRHKSSLEISDSCITASNNVWEVASANDTGKKYLVKPLSNGCTCKIVCQECETCVHTYSCTCPDYLLQHYMCKHIHAVHRIVRSQETNGKTSDCKPTKLSTENLKYYSRIVGKGRSPKHSNSLRLPYLEREVMRIISQLSDTVLRSESVDYLTIVKKHPDAAHAIRRGFKSREEYALKHKDVYSSNKNFKRQQRLFSTKKSTRAERNPLPTPGANEKKSAARKLAEFSPRICAYCFKGSMGDEEKSWLNCWICRLFIHRHCDIMVADCDRQLIRVEGVVQVETKQTQV